MKASQQRDKLQEEHGYKLIGVEMEAHGMMPTIPVGNIRGVCDYADEHKNGEWYGYAAATVAAYARELICLIHPGMFVILYLSFYPIDLFSQFKSVMGHGVLWSI